MKQLRTIRIILALLFLASSVAAILLGPAAYPVTRIARGSQVLLCSLGASAGASVVWLLFTLMFGRIYCATVCPAGTFSDIFIRLRQAVPRLRRKSAYTPARRVRYHILLLYALCALAGVTAVTLVLEPWNMMTDIGGAVEGGGTRRCRRNDRRNTHGRYPWHTRSDARQGILHVSLSARYSVRHALRIRHISHRNKSRQMHVMRTVRGGMPRKLHQDSEPPHRQFALCALFRLCGALSRRSHQVPAEPQPPGHSADAARENHKQNLT